MNSFIQDVGLIKPSAGHITDRRHTGSTQHIGVKYVFKNITLNIKIKTKTKTYSGNIDGEDHVRSRGKDGKSRLRKVGPV